MTDRFLARYGNPDKDGDGVLDAAWFNENIAVFDLPFPLVQAWGEYPMVRRFQAHRLAGPRIIAALTRMGAANGIDYLRANKLDRWGGCFNFRLVRGGDQLSAHSWGTAVDINPEIGRLGNHDDAMAYPAFIIESFTTEGFVWGGLWARADAMHFELQD